MAVNGLLETFPRTGSPDRAPGINTRTYVATAIFASMVSTQAGGMQNSNERDLITSAAITRAWQLADLFLLGG